MNKILTFLAISIVFISCEKGPARYKYNMGDLPDNPVNLSDFNTVYDDYNATAPSFGLLVPFCFSTNRSTSGSIFNVIYQPMNINFDRTSGVLKVTNEYDNWGIYADDFEVLEKAINKITTEGNELGPYLTRKYNNNNYLFTLMVASDISGDFQIYFTSDVNDPDFSDKKPVEFLNSEFDDLYPVIDFERKQIYFCSNRENNNFDIYYTHIANPYEDLELILSDTAYHPILKDTILSGNSDDKCPYIYDNILIFTSNRDGGFGGFDLYYSKLENNKWGEAVNFGPDINTEFDEYRPILFEEGVSDTEQMMVFSSNRDGGKGGFDLYFVGVVVD